MLIPESILNSMGIAVVGAILTFLTGWFWRSRNQAIKKAETIAADHEVVLARLKVLEDQAIVAGTVVTPIITAFQSLLIKQLTHDDKPEMDILMVKVGPPDTLTISERDRLLTMLHERSVDIEIDASEQDSAIIMPIVMRMAKKEQSNMAHLEGATDLKLVTIVSIVGTVPKAIGE